MYLSACVHATSASVVLLFTALGEWWCLGLRGLTCLSDVCVKYFPVTQTANLAEANGAEEDKIKAVVIQSCRAYDPVR